MQITDAQRYHLCIPVLGEQCHDLRSQSPDYTEQSDGIDQFDQKTCLEPLLHPLLMPCTLVLCQKSRHGMSDILLWCIGKIIHSVHRGKCRHDRNTLRIDHRLYDQFSQLQTYLLHGTGTAVADCLTQQALIEYPPLFPKT